MEVIILDASECMCKLIGFSASIGSLTDHRWLVYTGESSYTIILFAIRQLQVIPQTFYSTSQAPILYAVQGCSECTEYKIGPSVIWKCFRLSSSRDVKDVCFEDTQTLYGVTLFQINILYVLVHSMELKLPCMFVVGARASQFQDSLHHLVSG